MSSTLRIILILQLNCKSLRHEIFSFSWITSHPCMSRNDLSEALP